MVTPKDHDGLPPPLTDKSSRALLWEDILTKNNEIDSQQEEIRNLKEQVRDLRLKLERVQGDVAFFQRIVNIVRATVAD